MTAWIAELWNRWFGVSNLKAQPLSMDPELKLWLDLSMLSNTPADELRIKLGELATQIESDELLGLYVEEANRILDCFEDQARIKLALVELVRDMCASTPDFGKLVDLQVMENLLYNSLPVELITRFEQFKRSCQALTAQD